MIESDNQENKKKEKSKKIKGFTFVEILAVIVILGLLATIAIVGVTRYKDKARQNDYDAIAKSSYNAMEEYLSSHPSYDSVKLETLENEQLISGRIDPATKASKCNGSVVVEKSSEAGKINDYKYKVYLCCSNYKKVYTYPGGKADDFDDESFCNSESQSGGSATFDPSEPTPLSITCEPGKYLPKAKKACEICLSGYYCTGGTFPFKEDEDQGLDPCHNCYGNSAEGSSEPEQCFAKVKANYYVKTAKTCQINCPTGYQSTGRNVYYGSTSSCSPMSVRVTFNCNGGSGGGTQTFTYGKSGQKFSTTCTKSGYKLVGWKNTANGTSSQYDVSNSVSNDWIVKRAPNTTIYAHWEEESKLITCTPGKYLPKAQRTCKICRSGYYCPGGTFSYNENRDQGNNLCYDCYPNSDEGSSKVTQCYANVAANHYVKQANTCETNCPTGYKSAARKVFYGSTSSCSAVSVKVTFNCNGGTGGGTQTFTYGVSGQKFNKTCTRSGYTLAGWKNTANGSGDSLYNVTSGVSDSWIVQTAPEKTVYAHWVSSPGIEQLVGKKVYICRSAQTSPPYKNGNTYVKLYHLHNGDKRHTVGENIGTIQYKSPVKITGTVKITVSKGRYKGEERDWYTYRILDGAKFVDESQSYDVGIGNDDEHEYMINPACVADSYDPPCDRTKCVDDMS